MPTRNNDELDLDTDSSSEYPELDEFDELALELHKSEKETRPPLPIWKIVLIFLGILAGTSGLAVGIAAIIIASAESSFWTFSEWLTLFFMLLGGLAIILGGISGFWGGQRNIPIRIVSPSDASVVGTGMILCGYVIEDCIDNEVEITFYQKDGEPVHELVVPLEDGIFYSQTSDILTERKKTSHLTVEAWVVSSKSTERFLVARASKLEEMNVKREGLKVGNIHFFPVVYRDFADKAKIIFDPKRKEKGVIENVKINESRTTNLFFPSKNDPDHLIPFSLDRVFDMKQNALYFDIKRSRRFLYSLILFVMAVAYFIFPTITAFG